MSSGPGLYASQTAKARSASLCGEGNVSRREGALTPSPISQRSQRSGRRVGWKMRRWTPRMAKDMNRNSWIISDDRVLCHHELDSRLAGLNGNESVNVGLDISCDRDVTRRNLGWALAPPFRELASNHLSRFGNAQPTRLDWSFAVHVNFRQSADIVCRYLRLAVDRGGETEKSLSR